MKKKNPKKLIITLIIVAAAIVAAVFVVKKVVGSKSSSTTSTVQLEEITKQDLSDSVSLSGTITSESTTNYSSSAASEILTMNVQVGDTVKEGDVIATLDSEKIQDQITALQKTISDSAASKALTAETNQHALNSAVDSQNSQLASANQALADAQQKAALAQAAVDTAQKQVDADQLSGTYIDELTTELENENKNLTELLKQRDAGTGPADIDSQIAASKASIEDLNSKLQNFNDHITALETAKTALVEANAAVTAAQANVSTVQSSTDDAIYSAQQSIAQANVSSDTSTDSETQLKDLQKQLDSCEIVATADGVVTAVNAKVGDVNTANTTLVTTQNDGGIILSCNVEETNILKLEEGMDAIITANALPDEEINGTVTKVVRVASASSSTAASTTESTSTSSTSSAAQNAASGFSVQIQVDPCELISGMTAKAKVILTQKSDVLSVPYDQVKTDDSGNSYILVAQDNGDGTYTAVRKDFTPGEEINYYVEVLGGDVAEGDLCIMDDTISEGDTFSGSGTVTGTEILNEGTEE